MKELFTVSEDQYKSLSIEYKAIYKYSVVLVYPNNEKVYMPCKNYDECLNLYRSFETFSKSNQFIERIEDKKKISI